MKIFLGIDDCSNRLVDLAIRLREEGHTCDLVLRSLDSFFSAECSDDFIQYSSFASEIRGTFHERSGKIYFEASKKTVKLLDKYDLFIFHYADTLIRGHLDLPIIKQLGKKIIWIFAGSEVRWWETLLMKYPHYPDKKFITHRAGIVSTREPESHSQIIENYYSACESLNVKLNRVRMAELYADYILTKPDSDDLLIRDYVKTMPYLYGLDESNNTMPKTIDARSCKDKKLKLLHAPSNPKSKGTEWLVNTINNSKLSQYLDLNIISNVPNREVISEMRLNDLVFDQRFCWGVVSIESSINGAVPLCGQIDKEVYPGIPFQEIHNESNLLEVIEKYLNNKSQLEEDKNSCYNWVIHSIRNTVTNVLDPPSSLVTSPTLPFVWNSIFKAPTKPCSYLKELTNEVAYAHKLVNTKSFKFFRSLNFT